MPREYPRFIYFNSKETKSKGAFIVHTIPPRMILKVARMETGNLVAVFHDTWDACSPSKFNSITFDALNWVRMMEAKKLIDTEEVESLSF